MNVGEYQAVTFVDLGLLAVGRLHTPYGSVLTQHTTPIKPVRVLLIHMYESVLIPTDGSDGTAAAVREGIELAHRYGSTIHALSVIELAYTEESVADAGVWESVFETRKRECEAAVVEVDAAVASAGHELSVTTAIRQGYPATEIVAYADQHDVDCIVMGTHGRTGMRRYLLGSVTSSVVRRATRPVVTVQLTDPSVSASHNAILVATDGSAGSQPAVEGAIDLARHYNATLHVLSVVETKFASRAPIRRALETEANEAITSVVEQTPATLDTETHCYTGVVHEAIAEAIENNDIGMLVLGTHGREGLDRLLLGSVAERMIRTAAIPVMIVPSPDVDPES
ncbi:universal stress protein [Halocatena halophila]|uniref:universal stress protein n=1 Tax=Halocatena halophila TaxID=2814576 RepID=UPI002ED1B1D4